MRYFILITALLFAIPAQAQTFGAESFTLQNGMQVVQGHHNHAAR
jgi:hypothetical protein